MATAFMVAGDWDTVRWLVHPYLHWADGQGSTMRGRKIHITAVTGFTKCVPEPPQLGR